MMPMLTFDSIPQARVVRKGSQLFTPPPAPPSADRSALGEHLHNALSVAIGLWPLTGVVLLAIGLLWMAGMNSAP
jgi:hypothetical protein